MSSRFPKPYVNDVKIDPAIMEYVNFPTMGIGSRPSGLPKDSLNQIKSLEHVGKSAGGSK